MKDVSVIEVRVWGRLVGAVALDPSLAYYAFEYDSDLEKNGRRTSSTAHASEGSPFGLCLSDATGSHILSTACAFGRRPAG